MTAEPSPQNDEAPKEDSGASTAPNTRSLAEIERLIKQAHAISETAVEAEPFCRELLDLTVRATGSTGGALWLQEPNGQFSLQHEIGLTQLEVFQTDAGRAAHSQLLQTALDGDGVHTAPPRSGELSGAAAPNPTNQLLLIDTHQAEGAKPLLIEIYQAPDTPSAVRRGVEQVLGAMCSAAASFQRRAQSATLARRAALRDGEIEYAKAIYRQSSTVATAYAIANEGRQLIGCDRLTVVALSGRPKVLAVSGVDSPDPRSNAVRRLETLSELIAATGEPFEYIGSSPAAALPPQVEQALEAYIDEQHVRQLRAELLHRIDGKPEAHDNPIIGVIIAEGFTAVSPQDVGQRLQAVAEHAAIALSNAERNETRWWKWMLHGSRRAKIATAAVLAVLILIGLLPVDFAVSARGELQPKVRREVFAPMDAEIHRVSVMHNGAVGAGEVLAQLRSPKLEQELQKVVGEQDTTRKRIDALRSLRIDDATGAENETLSSRRFAAEIVELEARLESLEKQLATLRLQREQLHLRSPIDGEVITWDVQQLLDGRPVRRGQVLMTVVQPDGDWQAELKVPDRSIRHVLRAASATKTGTQAIRYILSSAPNATRHGVINEIGASVSMDRRDEPYVRVQADISMEDIADAQPGTTVAARISCGKRPLAYVLTHQVIEAIQTWLFF